MQVSLTSLCILWPLLEPRQPGDASRALELPVSEEALDTDQGLSGVSWIDLPQFWSCSLAPKELASKPVLLLQSTKSLIRGGAASAKSFTVGRRAGQAAFVLSGGFEPGPFWSQGDTFARGPHPLGWQLFTRGIFTGVSSRLAQF